MHSNYKQKYNNQIAVDDPSSFTDDYEYMMFTPLPIASNAYCRIIRGQQSPTGMHMLLIFDLQG